MKKTRYCIFTIFCFLLIFSCKKYNEAELPKILTGVVSNVLTTTATMQGSISNLGNTAITQHGHCWSSANDVPDYRINQGKTTLGPKSSDGAFTSNLTGLFPNTIYYIRSYYITGVDTIYGNDIKVLTTQTSTLPQAPNVATGISSAITTTTANIAGVIINIGTASITAYGHCYSSTATTPTIANSVTNFGASATAVNISSNISGLIPNTIYYYRAYATNSVGTSYGNVVTFTTSALAIVLPTVTTIDSFPIPTFDGFNKPLYGTLNSIGNSSITQLGHVFTSDLALTTITTSNSNVSLNNTVTTPNPFVTSIPTDALNSLTKYRYRAFATNTGGTAYGAEYYDYSTFRDNLSSGSLDGSGLGIGSKILGVSASYNGLLYFGMGVNASTSTSLDSSRYWVAYDPNTNLFTTKTKCPFNITGASSFVYNNKIYVVAGKLNNLINPYTTIFAYDPINNSWAGVASFPVQSFWSAAGFLIGDKYYFGTGTATTSVMGSTNSEFSLNKMYVYNLTNNTVTNLPDAPFTVRTGVSAFALNGLGYFVGGTDRNTAGSFNDKNECWQFSPTSNVWVQKASLISSTPNMPGVAYGRGDAYDNVGYIWAGKSFSTNTYYSDVCRYDPVKNKWKLVYKYPNNTIIYTYYAGIGNFVDKNLVGGCGDNQFNSNTFLFTLK